MNDKIINDNTLIITDSSNKSKILKKISSFNKLINIKIITVNELLKSFYFDYDEKAIYYLVKKYNIKPSVARIYIKNMYYVDNSNSNSKINKLYELKMELLDNNLLITNKYFKDYLDSKNIVIYNFFYIPNIVKNILKNYKYEIVNDSIISNKHSIYEFNTLEEEVEYVGDFNGG